MSSWGAISPALDKLAREGVLYDNAHTAAPVCMPARTSLMTGLHTHAHGAIENGISPRPSLRFLTDDLADAGYRTIMVGKTHFGPVPQSFQIVHDLRGEKNSDADDFYASHVRAHGYSRRTASMEPNPIPEKLFVDAHCVDVTIAEIDRTLNDHDGPFFAFCSLVSPHAPFDPPGQWADVYEGRPLPSVDFDESDRGLQTDHTSRLLDLPDAMEKWFPAGGRPDGHAIDRVRRRYYGLASYCDAQIGRFVDYLDERGIRDRTLVIFSSDHGTQLFDHGFDNKHTYHDASWRVPLIMSMPEALPAGQREGFAGWTDITASILAAAGCDYRWTHGFDLYTPLVTGAPSPRVCVASTMHFSSALVTRDWKIEFYSDTDEGRLFDRRNDPGERTNLYARPSHAALRNELLHELMRWRINSIDHAELVRRSGGGGPVAQRVVSAVNRIHAQDSERELNDRVAERESRWSG